MISSSFQDKGVVIHNGLIPLERNVTYTSHYKYTISFHQAFNSIFTILLSRYLWMFFLFICILHVCVFIGFSR